MTELSFLIELLLEHKLPKATRDAVASRIKLVQARLTEMPQAPLATSPRLANPATANQAPSMQAILERNPDLVPQAPQPVTQIAQTAATAQALAKRQESIAIAMSGKEEKGRTSPRKY